MKVVENHNRSLSVNRWKTPLSNYACAIRPIAAIMVTSIQGFSKTAEQDQSVALSMLNNSYKLQEYFARQYGYTRMVKLGEMVLLGFNSVDQAVQCAIKLERSARKMFSHKLSIGIHMGEVRYVDGDLFGGPVNIAQDVQKTAKPGQILLSESAAKSLSSGKFNIQPHGTSGPLAVPTFRLDSRMNPEVHSIWNYKLGNNANEQERYFRSAM